MSRCVSFVVPPTSVGVPPEGILWTRPPEYEPPPPGGGHARSGAQRVSRTPPAASANDGSLSPRFGGAPASETRAARAPSGARSTQFARRRAQAPPPPGRVVSPRPLRWHLAPLATPARTIWSPRPKARSSLRSPTLGHASRTPPRRPRAATRCAAAPARVAGAIAPRMPPTPRRDPQGSRRLATAGILCSGAEEQGGWPWSCLHAPVQTDSRKTSRPTPIFTWGQRCRGRTQPIRSYGYRSPPRLRRTT
jgi:hypothetical protein